MFLPQENHEPVLEELRRDLPGVDSTFTAGTMLSQLFNTVAAVDCNGVGPEQVKELANTLLGNPRYEMNPGYNQFHYKLMAGIARQQGQLEDTIANLEKAMAAQRSSELNMMMVTALGSAGEFEMAREFIDEAVHAKPLNPVRAFQWRRDLENLGDYIDELERYSERQE
jgi:tetratricopeptide (TPR) repeat protein